MTFASRITRAPHPYNPERGADAAARVPDAPAEASALLVGAGACSPYLASLIEREAGWLARALVGAPEATLDAVLADVSDAPDEGLAVSLRQAKRRVALLTGLADLGGVWTLDDVTRALTRFADLAVNRALQAALVRATKRTPELEAGGIAVLAMGKMGAFELNYSSDIDLICLIDDTCYSAAEFPAARAGAAKAVRAMAAMLSDVTAEGYVFRTDLRLRPDPAVTPVCVSMEAAERYYESLGRAWERAAYIKARAAAGAIAAGEGFLQRLTPFVWRRNLDFAAIQEAQSMRLKIREHKGAARRMDGFDIKLGPGGIREIEFYTQTRQIIAGGRDPGLRLRETVPALAALEAKGWTDAAEQLTADYRAHRDVEHRLQMIADRQTHALPTSPNGWARLAAFMGTDAARLRETISNRLTRVSQITDDFFTPPAARPEPEIGEGAAEIVAKWRSYPALRSNRAVEIFNRIKPDLLDRMTRAARPDEALGHFDGFLRGLPAGVQLFSLFDANPQLIDLIVDICATSPALAHYLSRHADVLDAVLGGSFFADWPGTEALTREVEDLLTGDYEAQLTAARRWRNDWHFRIGVHHLRGLVSAATAGQQYAAIAEAVLAALWPKVVAEFARKHGPPPGRGAVILGMGSLGAESLAATSDLDLIVIYDPEDQTASDGPRPLDTRPYYARLTQAFITALTAPMGPGRLYEVDMRLRPSGRQGPVATSLESFRTYQSENAWTWEHLALTRARAVAGDPGIAADVEQFRQALLSRPRERVETLSDVAEMRARLAAAKPGSAWDAKAGTGRLVDIELLAQTGALLAGSPARRTLDQLEAGAEVLALTEASTLVEAHELFLTVQVTARLLLGRPFDPEAVGTGGRDFLLRETGAADLTSLETRLQSCAGSVDEIVTKALR